MKYTLILENLNCAHCAGKIEQAIADTDGYEKVSFNFATKELRFESEKKHPAAEIQQIWRPPRRRKRSSRLSIFF